jgi:hypothetical protein
MPIIFIHQNYPIRIFFATLVPLNLLIIFSKTKTFHSVIECLNLLQFRLLVVLGKLKNSIVDYSASTTQHSAEITCFVQRNELIQVKRDLEPLLSFILTRQEISINNRFDCHFD